MTFTVLIPARLASTRLPDKALADIGGLPMVVRVARRAASSGARRVVVATDSTAILQACERFSVAAIMTRADHASGSDRLAEAAVHLGLDDAEVVVNVQGDEPLIDPALIDACAKLLQDSPQAVMSSAAHPINSAAEFNDPNVVKVVLDAGSMALYFSRAPIPWWRDGAVNGAARPATGEADLCPALRHIGIYAYRAGFLRRFPTLPMAPVERTEALEQMRVLWHGFRIAMHISMSPSAPGVDTPADLERVRRLIAGEPDA